MTTITDFLLARIADDQALAHAAQGTYWSTMTEETMDGENAYYTINTTPDDDRIAEIYDYTPEGQAASEHIARHDPARILDECEAKRRIIEMWQAAEADAVVDGIDDSDLCYAAGLRLAVGMLTTVYADHPDFDPTWAVK